MRIQIKNIPILIGILITTISITKGQEKGKGKRVGETIILLGNERNINWESYDTTSFVSRDELKYEHLQGLWKAYKGVYRFDNHVNAMTITEPFVFQVKGETFRRNKKGNFQQFIIQDNLVIQSSETKTDTGIVNKITPTELIISWKSNSNFTRYNYEK